MGRVYFKVDNLEEYTATGSIIYRKDTAYPTPPILLNHSGYVGWGTKPDSVKWYNDSDTLSRVGTSGLYTVG